jgi:hypothetical protein
MSIQNFPSCDWFLSLGLLADAHRCGLTDCGLWQYSRLRYRDTETIVGWVVLDNLPALLHVEEIARI